MSTFKTGRRVQHRTNGDEGRVSAVTGDGVLIEWGGKRAGSKWFTPADAASLWALIKETPRPSRKQTPPTPQAKPKGFDPIW